MFSYLFRKNVPVARAKTKNFPFRFVLGCVFGFQMIPQTRSRVYLTAVLFSR